jgi:hypothetical protein
MITSRSDIVRELIVNGDYKKALHIAKGFRLGIDIEDISKIKLAYECLVHKGFYEQIGTDTTTAITEGIQILISLYGQGEDGIRP